MAENQATNKTRTFQDLTGQRFGVVVVLGRAESIKSHGKWLCRCDCGNIKTYFTSNLTGNKNATCHCSHRPRGNQSGSRGYKVWNGMIQRCYNPKRRAYPRYGGRGIGVCPRWRESFDAFMEDMGPDPTGSLTIERIDNDGNYEPSNCRWASVKEQARNRRSTRYVSYQGEQLSLAELAERIGMDYHKLFKRLTRGWTLERAISNPNIRKRRTRLERQLDEARSP